VASTYPDNFNQSSGADGLLGMGFKEISPFNTSSFFETLVDEGQLAEPVFGFYPNASNSELIIGGRNSSQYSGNLTYVNVEKQVRILRGILCFYFNTDTIQGYWQTAFDAISVNGSDISVSTRAAIIDTGTRYLLGDQESISNIYATIPGSAPIQDGLWTSTLVTMFDCQRG
jgi:hypothetical protein